MQPLSRAVFACVLAGIAASPPPAAALEPDALYEKLEPSSWGVVRFDADGRATGLGSAVVIGPGRLITNCHVLKGARAFQVTKLNVSYGGTLEFADPERDLCQIKVANFFAPAVEIGDVDKLRVGQKVYALGNPQGLESTLSEGLVSSLRHISENGLPLIQTTAAISPGSSGGGLYDRDGKLVGITTFLRQGGQNLNFAHPANWIAEVEARHRAAMAKVEEQRVTSGRSSAIPGYGGPHRIGDQWVYNLTDRYTGRVRSVRYQIDDIDPKAARISFNQGGKVEDTEGVVVELPASIGGEFDMSMPPGGWLRFPLSTGKTWRATFEKINRNGNAVYQFDLRARVARNETIVVPAGKFMTTRIDWEGTLGHPVIENGPYRASIWYSTDLQRVVKFTADYTAYGVGAMSTATSEVLELVRHPESKQP